MIGSRLIARRRRRRMSTHRGYHPHLILKGVLAITVATAFAAASLISAEPSMAATKGAGVDASAFGGFLGNEITPTGVRGYCADPSRSAPFGSTDNGASVDTFSSDTGHVWSGDDLKKINWVLTHYGDTSDDTQAAAVNAYIYAFTGSSLGGGIAVGTHDEGAAYIDPSFNDVASEYDRIWSDAEANWNAGPASAGTGTMNFTTDSDNFHGTVSAAVTPPTAVGTITLVNATFDANGTATMSGVTDGQTYSITGKAPSDGDTSFRISGTGSFTRLGVASPDANVTLFTTGGEQRLLSAGTSSTATSTFSVAGSDTVDRTTLFAPTVSTAASTKFVSPGEHPRDALTFSTTSFTGLSGSSVSNPWRQNSTGDFDIIHASGTLYGPSQAPFTPSPSAPPGTSIAGHGTVATDPHKGPSGTYTATSDTAVTAAGYYTWVWTITSGEQTDSGAHLPLNYSFHDSFGQFAETQVTPGQLTFETQLSSAQSALDDTVTDLITPRLTDAHWLQADGQKIPVTLTGTIYFSPDKPTQSKVPPTTATAVGTLTQVISDTTPITSKAIKVGNKAGWVTIQWAIRRADQATALQGMITDWSDDYGIPAETLEVAPPTIITKAQPQSAPGGTVQDIATVSGPVPAAGIDIAFAGYLQTAGSTAPICNDSNKKFESANPTLATAPGDFPSEKFEVPTTMTGTVLWVETAAIHGTGTIIHQGACGQPGESTDIEHPTVTTTPPVGVHDGQATHDVATVNGWINEGTTLTFRLYKQADGATSLECTDATAVGQPLGPVKVAAGLAASSEYVSPDSDKLSPGHYGFVEQLVDHTGTVMHTGGCHDELFTVSAAETSLALTGISVSPTRVLACGLLAAGLAAVILLFALRRRSARPTPQEVTTQQ